MEIARKPSFDELRQYVRTHSSGDDVSGPYDVNAVVHLMLAALDNLMEHWTECDMEQLRDSVDDEQRKMLVKFGKFLEA